MAQIDADRVFVYGGVVDLRKGADGLRALVGATEPDVLYIFSNRSRELLKFLSVDATGVWCGTRRLHRSRFAWPESPAGKERLTTGRKRGSDRNGAKLRWFSVFPCSANFLLNEQVTE